MITETRIINQLMRLKGDGDTKAGRVRDALLAASSAVHATKQGHRRATRVAMEYLTTKRMEKHHATREEIRMRNRMYASGYYYGTNDRPLFMIDPDMKENPDWLRGYKVGSSSIRGGGDMPVYQGDEHPLAQIARDEGLIKISSAQ